jgi:NitT/TauT family transport system permease protein
MALAIIGSVVAEFVQSSEGLGFLLLQANSTLDTALFFAAIVALTVIGIVLYEIVEIVERFVLRNRKQA